MVINLKDFEGKYRPKNEEDFNRLFMYKPKTLIKVLRYDITHRKQIMFYLFSKLLYEEQINEFKKVLIEINEYDNFIKEIINSKNINNIIHLALYYENSLIEEYFNGEENLVKQISKRRNISRDINNYAINHLTKLASITDSHSTLLLVKDAIKNYVKLMTKIDYAYIASMCMISGTKDIKKYILEKMDDRRNITNLLTSEAEKQYQLSSKRNRDFE